MVLCDWSHSRSHILWYILGWETWMEANPSSNFCRWSSTLVRSISELYVHHQNTIGDTVINRRYWKVLHFQLVMKTNILYLRKHTILKSCPGVHIFVTVSYTAFIHVEDVGTYLRDQIVWLQENDLYKKLPTLQIREMEANNISDEAAVFGWFCLSFF